MTSEPEIDLKRLENRLRTFDNWPVTHIQPAELARAGKIFSNKKWHKFSYFLSFFFIAGFYYLNNSDQVKCIECGGIIGKLIRKSI